MNDKYTVYIHANKVNNKRYVGITSQSLERRWRQGFGYKRNHHFFRAIEKYGWDNFEHIVVKENISLKEAAELEKLLITQYNTTDKKRGYNKSSGGEASAKGNRFHLSEEQKKRQREAMTGKPKSEAHKKALSAARSGKPNFKKRRPVVCVETGVIYSGVNEAKTETHIEHISRACNGKLKTAGGYHWRFI